MVQIRSTQNHFFALEISAAHILELQGTVEERI